MSIADLVRKLASAGASPDVIALAVEAVEAEQQKLAEVRSKRASQKANERARRATVARQGSDIPPTVGDPLSPKEIPPEPPKEITPIPNDVKGESRDARERHLEFECRKIGAELPVVCDPDFTPVLGLLDAEPALLPADVLAAMGQVVETKHKLKFWGKLDPWIRKAARDRIEAAMPPANYARAGPHGQSAASPFPTGGRQNVQKDKSAQDVARDIVEGFARRSDGGPDLKLLA